MERCGFFDANLAGEEYDRVYLASQFAAYFASFIGNGVYANKSNELQVVEQDLQGMAVNVLSGQGWINGYWYENTESVSLAIDIADGVLNRVDSVVLRLGFSERNMWVAIKKGTPAISPLAPALTRNADYYELQLATINIPANSIKITQAQITDTRLDTSVCGWVTGVVQQIDTSTLFNQFDAAFNDAISENQSNWDAWFATVQGTLDEDTAGHLLNLINQNTARISVIPPRRASCALPAAAWAASGENFVQTVQVSGVTGNTFVTLLPTAAQAAQMLEDGTAALIPESGTGTVSVTSVGAAPTVDMTLEILLQEVNAE